MTVTTDVIRRVFLDDEGVCLEIGPNADCPDVLELRTADKKSIEWFGKVNVPLTDEFALALSNALIAAVGDKS